MFIYIVYKTVATFKNTDSKISLFHVSHMDCHRLIERILSLQIFSNLFGIHHDERFWADPWAFQPERFLTEQGTVVADDHPVMKKYVFSYPAGTESDKSLPPV